MKHRFYPFVPLVLFTLSTIILSAQSGLRLGFDTVYADTHPLTASTSISFQVLYEVGGHSFSGPFSYLEVNDSELSVGFNQNQLSPKIMEDSRRPIQVSMKGPKAFYWNVSEEEPEFITVNLFKKEGGKPTQIVDHCELHAGKAHLNQDVHQRSCNFVLSMLVDPQISRDDSVQMEVESHPL